MPDRKFTPSGDKPFENGMNSLRFLRVCSMWWAKVNFASRNNPRYFATRTQGTGWPKKIWTGLNRLRGLGPLVTLHGKVKAAHYVNILGDRVHPFVQTSFPGECPLYQDDNALIHTAKIVQEWFAEHEGEVGRLDWPPQSPDLNIIEHLWGYLESKLRARFPPPSTISALETALHEEWLHIPLQVVHDLFASIPRRIQSVIQ
ncbi:transposable element Tc1 transposase [Trichonephila clavipes]|uniref:Transposable element Tc1 transposase n=1 Tax=Trichonephila clavipes TaxID=2585209 RepID=A0A8X6RL85_TRICX|nr:transposable element Tc1 transposase [Trichonephila clavipes]